MEIVNNFVKWPIVDLKATLLNGLYSFKNSHLQFGPGLKLKLAFLKLFIIFLKNHYGPFRKIY